LSATLGASEVIEITTQSFSYQVGSRAMLALSDEIDLFQHCRGQSDQDLLGHKQQLLKLTNKSQGPASK
jgi:hypothetical protein